MQKRHAVRESVLSHKKILLVDDETDILDVLKAEITEAASSCVIDTAVSYRDASALLATWTYDLAIFDIMGVRGFELLDIAVMRPNPIPVVMLTARALSPGALRDAIEKGARAYLPKEHLGAIVPFLEDVLTNEYGPVWRRVLKRAEGIFNEGWGPYWRNLDVKFWREFETKIDTERK